MSKEERKDHLEREHNTYKENLREIKIQSLWDFKNPIPFNKFNQKIDLNKHLKRPSKIPTTLSNKTPLMNLKLTKNFTVLERPNNKPHDSLVLQKQSNSLVSKIKRVDFAKPAVRKFHFLDIKIPPVSFEKTQAVETPATALIKKHIENSVARQLNYRRPNYKRDF